MDIRESQMPRMLVISFSCLLSTNANGRTLINLLDGYDSSSLAQLFMAPNIPNYKGCSSYFRVTDDDALKSLRGKKVGQIVSPESDQADSLSNVYKYVKVNRKKPFLRYAREIVWELGRWKSKAFNSWIDKYDPQIILLFSGNNSFIDKIALEISKKLNIPIVLYNCEDYFLKPANTGSLFSWIYRMHNDKAFKKTMQYVSGVIYNTKKLANSYRKYFPNQNSIILMNPANEFFKRVYMTKTKHSNEIVYLGNISVGREKSLCAVADVLGEIKFQLCIYGNFASEQAKQTVLSNSNIIYRGVVSYDECCRIMQESLLLVHCESFAKNHEVDLRHALTTKVADSLASGTCLFVYAPEKIALTEYLQSVSAAVVVTSKDMLKKKLLEIISNDSLRQDYVQRALEAAENNHDKEIISLEFRKFIVSCYNQEGKCNDSKRRIKKQRS